MRRLGTIVLMILALAGCEEKPYKPPVPHTGGQAAEPGPLVPERNAPDQAKGAEHAIGEGAGTR